MALLATCGLLLLAGCGGSHDDTFREVADDDCSACHLGEYQAAREPPHPAFGYSQQCAGCHSSKFWRPPFDPNLHTNDAFAIDVAPHVYACEDCHNPALDVTSIAGLNTDCVGCHEGAHSLGLMDEVHKDDPDYPLNDPRPNFCLDCHPDGRFDEDL
jgi:hypothetical protein